MFLYDGDWVNVTVSVPQTWRTKALRLVLSLINKLNTNTFKYKIS